jgi:hypothetical protein
MSGGEGQSIAMRKAFASRFDLYSLRRFNPIPFVFYPLPMRR